MNPRNAMKLAQEIRAIAAATWGGKRGDYNMGVALDMAYEGAKIMKKSLVEKLNEGLIDGLGKPATPFVFRYGMIIGPDGRRPIGAYMEENDASSWRADHSRSIGNTVVRKLVNGKITQFDVTEYLLSFIRENE